MTEPAHAAIGATDVGRIDVEHVGLGPIRLGAGLFTLVDPHRGHEVAYNRWYERDHLMAGCTVGPYCFDAGRWVAPADLKRLRWVDPSEQNPVSADPMRGSYLSLYWLLAGWVDDWNRWAYREFKWLHDNGRMFPHRDHVHTLLYRHDWAHYRDPDPVPATLALKFPYNGLAVVVGDAVGDRDSFDDWARGDWLPRLQRTTTTDMTLSFSPIPLQVEAKGVARDEGSATRFLHLHFLRGDPRSLWPGPFDAARAALEVSGHGRLWWGGAFIPTLPGTDRYSDELW